MPQSSQSFDRLDQAQVLLEDLEERKGRGEQASLEELIASHPALEAELIGYARQQLAHLKCPKTVDFEPELPRHPTGKLYKRLLRDRYWGNKESRIV